MEVEVEEMVLLLLLLLLGVMMTSSGNRPPTCKKGRWSWQSMRIRDDRVAVVTFYVTADPYCSSEYGGVH